MAAAGGEAAAVVCSLAAKNGIKSVAEQDWELDSLPFCYPFGPDPVSVGFTRDGVGGASEIAGLDLCQVHVGPYLSTLSCDVCLFQLGSVVPDWPKVFSTPCQLTYPHRERHLAGSPPSWTPAPINADCGVSSPRN